MKIQHFQLTFLSLTLLLASSCSRNSDPALSGISVLATADIIDITTTTAISGGNITDNGGAAVTARGVCWSRNANPTIANPRTTDGTGSGAFVSSITGLINNTTYHVRSYATNSAGTAYGDDLSFTASGSSSNCGTVTDIDGNVYNTVTIGTKCWMSENLKTTRYNDGTAITTGLDAAAWQANRSGAYAIYDNNIANNTIYGKLYNWYAVNTGKLAPAGWHVASDSDWIRLTTYLGGDSIAGDKMKSQSSLWTPYTGIVNTNSSGFSALPAGFKAFYGTENGIGDIGYFWSSTENGPSYARNWFLYYTHPYIEVGGFYKDAGFSVRCVRD